MTPADLVLTPRGVRFMGRTFPCSIGKGKLRRNKGEGDGATPTGTHRITGMLYRPDRMSAPARWAHPIHPGDLWCDAPGHPAYNLPVRMPFSASHEHLRRADPLYDLILITDYNYPIATPGAGSAIFLHTWRAPHYPTAGCIAFRKPDLIDIASRIAPGTRLIIPPLASLL